MAYHLLTFQGPSGPRAGVAVDGAVHDAAVLLGDEAYASVLAILNDWPTTAPLLDAAARVASGGQPLERIRLLAPILYPGDIYCAGANYTDHIDEMNRGMDHTAVVSMKDAGEEAWHFVKAGRATCAGPGDVITLPAYTQMADWEIELAAVIGRPARHVSEADALDYVAGYTIANDLTVRDLARPNIPAGSPFRFDFLKGKSFDGSCPTGPWITPASAIPDPQALGLKLWVNDELKQDSSSSLMISGVAEQISVLSSRLTLYPGDLVLTGTPAGVGIGRGEFLRPGDRMRLWIEGIGELTNTVA